MECKLCFEPYDTDSRKPMNLHPCNHTYCKQCLDQLNRNECPNCRTEINDKRVNYALVEVIEENNVKLLKSNIQKKLNEIEIKKTKYFQQLNESINIKNESINKKIYQMKLII